MSVILTKRLTLTASPLRTRERLRKGRGCRRGQQTSGRCSPRAELRPVIHATFPLAEASEARSLMETSNHIGKIVLTV